MSTVHELYKDLGGELCRDDFYWAEGQQKTHLDYTQLQRFQIYQRSWPHVVVLPAGEQVRCFNLEYEQMQVPGATVALFKSASEALQFQIECRSTGICPDAEMLYTTEGRLCDLPYDQGVSNWPDQDVLDHWVVLGE